MLHINPVKSTQYTIETVSQQCDVVIHKMSRIISPTLQFDMVIEYPKLCNVSYNML